VLKLCVTYQQWVTEHYLIYIFEIVWSGIFYRIFGVSELLRFSVGHHLPNFCNSQFDVYLVGWTHTRNYAKGYINTDGGSATATVTGFTPGQMYNYEVYEYEN